MKYLEEPELNWINSFLDCCQVGDRSLTGKVEAFSCKKVGSDRKFAKNLDLQYQNEVASHPSSTSSCSHNGNSYNTSISKDSASGSLADPCTRKILINLISTLNASYPDYDFSNCKLDSFTKIYSVSNMINHINTQLAEIVEIGNTVQYESGFLERLWNTINQVIHLNDEQQIEIYSYLPSMEQDDPLNDGSLWSFNFFIYNKTLRKILFFTCSAKSELFEDEMEDDEMEEEDSEEDHFNDYSDGVEWEDGV